METSLRAGASTRIAVFAWLWALAVVLHLLYLTNSYAAFSAFTADHVIHLALAVAAVALLLRPRSFALLATVCALTPITAWFEAPRLGNHWLLASLVSLALLGALALGRFARPRDVPSRVDGDGLPSARLIFLLAYGFCALAKFNTSFVDPAVSCANLFADEVANSLGLSQFSSVGDSWWMHALPWVVMAIESSVVVLLVLARTRVLGVILALLFHGLIAFDTAHAFSDFTSVITALVILFLPESFFVTLSGWLRPRFRQTGVVVVATVSAGLLVWQSTDTQFRSMEIIGDSRDWLWWIVWGLVTVAALTWTLRTRILHSDVDLLPEDRWLLMWPAVTFLIGCGPYLEVRTGTSWNMYANLQTANGSSNSFLISATAALSDAQSDPVRILSTSDNGLQQYIESAYELPFVNLRAYTSTQPDASLSYERNGVAITVDHTREDPALGTQPTWWEQKVLVFRALDTNEPIRCQNTMLPAR